MKRFHAFFQSVIIAAIISGLGSFAWAKKMDLDTHTAVIQKLQSIVQGLDDNDPSKVPSALRLADLLAERSRLKSLKEVEQNCTNCLQSKEDRRQALNYYIYVVPLLQDEVLSQALLQKAHLHFALGEINETEKIYVQMTKDGRKRHSAAILGQAHASLGDVYFQKAEFKKAKEQYDKALAIAQTPQRGLVYYRLSWCLFNLDQVKKAITTMEMVLKTPKLTEMNGSDGLTQDESFKIDVSKDLATFYARSSIDRNVIARLQSLSPATHRQDNLFFLGTEADRLGKKKEAALVWVVYLENSGKDKEALEAQVRLMRLKRDMGDAKGALVTFKHVQDLWQSAGCGDKCEIYQNQIRKWITDWNREEKSNQTVELTQAYILYTQTFPDDADMFFWGAEVAKQRKQYLQASQLYRQASVVSHKKLKNAEKNEVANLTTIFNSSLIGEIDMSETLKSYDLRIKAYSHYLQMNPKGPKEFEVRYQIAQAEFEAKNYEKSAVQFKNLAMEKRTGARALQKTAADMSLESLVKLKRDDAIETWSFEYTKHFKEAQNEYALIHRKTVLNSVAAKINQKTADSSDLKRLETVSMIGSTPQDRISISKSRYLLAIRLENFVEAKKANQTLLMIKELSKHDLDEAVTNRIWLAEMELDFRTAYNIAQTQTGRMTAERALRLVYLAQMAGLNPEKHENDFLKLSQNRSARATVIVNRIQRQTRPDIELKKHLVELSKSPETLSKLTLEVFSKTQKRAVLEDSFKFTSVRRSGTGAIIGRLLEYKDVNASLAKVAAAKLNPRSDKLLKASLENRIKLMKDLEKDGQRAISNKDLVLQAVILNTLRIENDRLYSDILKLPIPRGLNPQQVEQYKTLVAAQAAPYKAKSDQITQKLNLLWSQGNWDETIAQNYVQARSEYKPALRQDMQQLIRHAPPSKRSIFENALSQPDQRPSAQSVTKVRTQVQKYPFQKDYVMELKDLESRRGNDIVVAHLEARLQTMKGVLR